MLSNPLNQQSDSPEPESPGTARQTAESAADLSAVDFKFNPDTAPPILDPLQPGISTGFSPMSRAEVSDRMQRDGFAELELIWNHVLQGKQDRAVLSASESIAAASAHTAPLFELPATIAAGLAASGAFVSHAYLTASGLPSPLLEAWLAGNLTMMGILSLCGFQRYISSPLMRTMGDVLESMLTQPDFRSFISASPRFEAFNQQLERRDLKRSWDDPVYRATYTRGTNGWNSFTPATFEQQIHALFQDFLGTMDHARRMFVPGDYTPHLLQQKKSVTRFIQSHKEMLAQSRAGELSIDAGLDGLKDLLRNEVDPDSEGFRLLSREIERIERRIHVSADDVSVEVWKRDPWTDLTHQEEFYSSASLRGVKKMGRGSKGRLGTFNYLLNPSISALDFSTNKGRAVRARCCLAHISMGKNETASAIFVDGVEGSNAVPPAAILMGLRDYARACNVDFLCVNAFPLNLVPKRFSTHFASTGAPLKSVRLELLDSTTREYLDAFGLPVQPFEYAFPRGKVLCFVESLKETGADRLSPPSLVDLMTASMRSKFVWGYFAQAVAGSALLVGSTAPLALIPLGILAAGGAGYQLFFQRRSLTHG